MNVVHSINGTGKVCDFCGFTDKFLYQGVDCVAQFGSGFATLCGFCDELNDMLWDMADISKQAGRLADRIASGKDNYANV